MRMRLTVVAVMVLGLAGCGSDGGGADDGDAGGNGPDIQDWVGTYSLTWTCNTPGGCTTSTGYPPVATTATTATITASAPASFCDNLPAGPDRDACFAQPFVQFDYDGGGSFGGRPVDSADLDGTSAHTVAVALNGPGYWTSCFPRSDDPSPDPALYCPLTKTADGFSFTGTYEVADDETYDWTLTATRTN